MSAGNVLGAIVPSLSTELQSRQSSTCSFETEGNYTTTGNSKRISGEFNCEKEFCFQNVPVDSSYLNNNRTFNDSFAAEPQFDMFFEMLQNQTGRQFPALSSVQMDLDLMVQSGSFSVGFPALSLSIALWRLKSQTLIDCSPC